MALAKLRYPCTPFILKNGLFFCFAFRESFIVLQFVLPALSRYHISALRSLGTNQIIGVQSVVFYASHHEDHGFWTTAHLFDPRSKQGSITRCRSLYLF